MSKKTTPVNLDIIAYKIDQLDIKVDDKIKGVNEKIDTVTNDVKKINETNEKKYVTMIEFEPIKNIVYGLVGVVLLAVAGAVIALVIKQ